MIHRPQVSDGPALLDWIRARVGSLVPAGRILDVGAGGGTLPGRRDVVAFDLQPAAPHLDQVAGDLGTLPFSSGSFESTICVNVFTNVEPQKVQSGIAEMLRVTRPGGRLVFSSPNLDHPLVRFRSMLWRFRTRQTGALSSERVREWLTDRAEIESCDWVLPFSQTENPVRRGLAEGYAKIATRIPRLSPHWIMVVRRSHGDS